jgi:hypothetical protein
MNIDLYTKTVLSVIAACLFWLCLNTVTPTAAAQAVPTRPTPVTIVDERGTPLITAQGLRVNLGSQPWPVTISNQSVPVMIGNQMIPVSVMAIERRGTWQPIQVDVMRAPSTSMPTP